MRARLPFTIYYRKLKIGKVYYCNTYNKQGKRVQFSTGKLSKKEAHLYCLELYKQDKLCPSEKTLLKDYAAVFFTEKCPHIRKQERWSNKKLSVKYIKTMHAALRSIVEVLGDVAIQNLKAIAIEEALQTLSERYANGSLNKALGALSIVLQYAEDNDLIMRNPCKKVRNLHSNGKERGIITSEEARRLFSIVWDNAICKMFNKTAALTGMRRGELLALQVEDVHREHVVVHRAYGWGDGVKERTKTGRSRHVPISEALYTELQAIMGASGFVFSRNGGATMLGELMPCRHLQKALCDIGIDREQQKERNITFHSWRHFFNTFCQSAGIPVSKLRAVMGHSTQAMTDHYTHFNVTHFAEVMKAQGAILGK